MDRISSPKLFNEGSLFLPGIKAGELTFVAADAREASGQIHGGVDAGSQARRECRSRVGFAATGCGQVTFTFFRASMQGSRARSAQTPMRSCPNR